MKIKTSISFLFALFICLYSSAQSFSKEKEDSLLTLLFEKNKAMGSVAVIDNGNIIYARAIGYRETLPQLPSDVNTKYRIGSISKMFTATLVFQLIEQGKVDLSTTLDKFFPSVPNASKITIANLLSHRSGIHNFTNDPQYMTYMLKPMTRDQLVEIISANKADFEPGEKTEYSNSNFVLLGFIVEDLYKKPYSDILQKQICSKADLNNTYYGSKTDLSKNECYSFQFNNEWIKQPETDMSIPHGAGAIVSTPGDLVKFLHALFNGVLVNETSLNSMKTIIDRSLGMGMMQFPYFDKKVYGHGGSIDGFSSVVCYLPEEKAGFSYISNGTVYSTNDILFRTMNNYFGKYDKLPEFKTFDVKPEDLNQYVGMYACPDIPIKVNIVVKDGKLMGQGSGQPEITLEPVDKDTFKFEQAGIVMVFHPDQNSFILEQGGGKFTFTRE
jgi:CubicO group peptidase (beta-lactamase class C family)